MLNTCYPVYVHHTYQRIFKLHYWFNSSDNVSWGVAKGWFFLFGWNSTEWLCFKCGYSVLFLSAKVNCFRALHWNPWWQPRLNALHWYSLCAELDMRWPQPRGTCCHLLEAWWAGLQSFCDVKIQTVSQALSYVVLLFCQWNSIAGFSLNNLILEPCNFYICWSNIKHNIVTQKDKNSMLFFSEIFWVFCVALIC